MNPWIRWGKFNLVGAVGMAVQLSTLALFNRWMEGRYLLASAAAIELTLLHNFLWHMRFTWRDRFGDGSWIGQMVRFQMSNGLVSLLGNLLLMRLLVHGARLPLLAANTLAIACCSVLNFCFGNQWAFRASPDGEPERNGEAANRLPSASVLLALLLCPLCRSMASAQSSSSEIDAPVPHQGSTATAPRTTYSARGNDTYLVHAGAFCGVGASTSPAASRPSAGCGAGFTLVPFPVFVEVGIMAPQANRSYVSGYISVDGSIPLARITSTYLPLAILGYSRLFETGHALDYGLALALPRFSKQHPDMTKSLRLELRDYWTFANPAQHNIMLRIGWMAQEID